MRMTMIMTMTRTLVVSYDCLVTREEVVAPQEG